MRTSIHVPLKSFIAIAILLGPGLVGSAELARGDGFIVIDRPEPLEVMPHPRRHPRIIYMPLEVKYHHVEAEITDNVAVTRIDQVFHNPNKRQMEGTYIFPLPDDVAVQRFSMYMNDKEVEGEVLDKDKARKIYEDIVRKMKDPALLEYVGSRMYKARVFPIPASGDVRIKLDYSQLVAVWGGLATYRYPLNTEKFSSALLGEVAVRVRIKSQLPLTTVFCPSHKASVDRKGEHEAVVGYEARNVLPDKDFIVGYQVSDKEFGLALLMHREGGEDGYFMARVAPSSKLGRDRVVPKDICFVIDTSGSMSGKKIEQAREALRFCLDNLNREDRFNVIAFSTEARPYRDALISASRDNVADARKHAADLKAIGGTAINDALLAALESGRNTRSNAGRPYMIVFLTDGLPTIGETDVAAILKNVKQANTGNVRLFVFGVGSDVNTKLLDQLAEDNHGAREYVTEQEDLEIKLSGFYTMIAHPVLSDVKLAFGEAGAHDVHPKVLPDLFKGTELVVFGRYTNAGHQSISLRGQQGDASAKFTWEREFPKREAGQEYLPRLWASRKIGYLLDQIRLHGEDAELKQEVVRLAKKHGILTPYTSFLVIEDDKTRLARGVPLDAPAASQILRSPALSGTSHERRQSFYGVSGRGAVEASKEVAGMRFAQRAENELDGDVYDFLADAAVAQPGGLGGFGGFGRAGQPGASVIRFVGSRAFYSDGEKWVDSKYKEGQETVKVQLFSDQYFDLIGRQPEAGKYFALGNHVIVILDGKAYETIEQ